MPVSKDLSRNLETLSRKGKALPNIQEEYEEYFTKGSLNKHRDWRVLAGCNTLPIQHPVLFYNQLYYREEWVAQDGHVGICDMQEFTVPWVELVI